ncbi:MAG: hypothetical protein KJ795_04110 [Gammaproteobacteria bacterium]|nr:hypothetical protein [Gammaproteobacteria bacterium]MBU1776523.1 hypothetical protein [Gammaproteobacteria bacterium]MBU1968913.1 hypothetical protein [Gammaproteobacteria bacterium]
MRNIVNFLSRCSPAMLLGCCLVSTPVAAAESTETAPVRLKSMSQAEYEAYRERLQKQVKEAAVNTQEPDKTAETEAEKELNQSEDSGYGRGYRSRTERSARTGGGYRGGAMSRGGGGGGGRGR